MNENQILDDEPIKESLFVRLSECDSKIRIGRIGFFIFFFKSFISFTENLHVGFLNSLMENSEVVFIIILIALSYSTIVFSFIMGILFLVIPQIYLRFNETLFDISLTNLFFFIGTMHLLVGLYFSIQRLFTERKLLKKS